MPKSELNNLEKNIISILKDGGRIPTARIAEKLSVTTPTIRSRLKAMIGKGVLKVSAMVDPSKTKGLTIAIVCIDIESRGQLKTMLKKISNLDQVNWSAVVTGRFDIIAEVVLTNGTDDLFDFTSNILPTIGKVTHCESFVVIRSERKWLYPTQTMDNW